MLKRLKCGNYRRAYLVATLHTKWNSAWVITIQIRFGLTRFRKDFSMWIPNQQRPHKPHGLKLSTMKDSSKPVTAIIMN